MDGRLHRRRGAGLSFLMGGDGEPLVLLHGVPGSSLAWQKVGIKVTSRFRVVIPDLMGFGASDPPGADFYLEAQAHAVAALLQYLQIDTLFLGGHDFGAGVAVTLMRLYPELNVRGLVLSATNLFADAQLPFPMRLASWPGLNQLFAMSMAGNRLGLRLLYETATQNKDDAAWRDFRHHFTRSSIKLMRRVLPRSLANSPDDSGALAATLPHLTCPALLLWGDDDPFCTVYAGELAHAALPDALLKVYAYTGHFVPEERALECAEDIVLRFTGVPLDTKSS